MAIKISIKPFIEIFGLLAVVGSLLFVGMQLSLDRQIAGAEQYFLRSEARQESLRAEFQNNNHVQEVAKRWEAGRTPSFWGPDVEAYMHEFNEPMEAIVRQSLLANITFLSMDNLHYQYEQGMLDEGMWPETRKGIRSYLQNPVNRAVVQRGAIFLRPSMRELVNELTSSGNFVN